MIYKDIKCESCKTEFKENDDVVVCPICGAPYHRECWQKNNSCIHASEHLNGYRWERPKTNEPEPDPKKYGNNEFILKNGESVIICPKCSAINCENDIYCARCKSLLREQYQNNNNNSFNREYTDYTGEDNSKANMNETFNRFGAIHPDAELDGIPVREYSDFVGGNSPGKIIRRIAIMERFGKKFYITFAPFVFGPIWFFWRKMVKEGLLISLALVLLNCSIGLLQINPQYIEYVKSSYALVAEFAGGTISRDDFIERSDSLITTYSESDFSRKDTIKMQIASIIDVVAKWGVPVVCSVTSLYFYRKKCKNSILNIREKCSNMEEYRSTLIKEGGTSFGYASIGILLVALSYFCANFLPMFWIGLH